MAFWIAIGLIVLAWLIAVIVANVNWYYDFDDTASAAAIATFFIAFIGSIVIALGASSTADRTPEMTDQFGLRALVTKEETESNASAVFFLGFGYANSSTSEVSSISYIETANDGGNTIRKVGIGESVIYEDLSATDAPFVENWGTRFTTNGWWIPWTVTGIDAPTTYRFHIPDGSIYEGYEVNP